MRIEINIEIDEPQSIYIVKTINETLPMVVIMIKGR